MRPLETLIDVLLISAKVYSVFFSCERENQICVPSHETFSLFPEANFVIVFECDLCNVSWTFDLSRAFVECFP